MTYENITIYLNQIKNGQELDDISSLLDVGDKKRMCDCKCHQKGRDRVQTMKVNRDTNSHKIQPSNSSPTERGASSDPNLQTQYLSNLELKEKEIELLKAQLASANNSEKVDVHNKVDEHKEQTDQLIVKALLLSGAKLDSRQEWRLCTQLDLTKEQLKEMLSTRKKQQIPTFDVQNAEASRDEAEMVKQALIKLCKQNNDKTADDQQARDPKFESVLKIQGPAADPHYCDPKKVTFFANGNYDTFSFNRVIDSKSQITDSTFDFVMDAL